MKKTEIAIIGGGSAGITAYHKAKKTGRTTILINNGEDDTTCDRVGFMASKSFIQIARDFSRTTSFAKKGIENSGQLTINFPHIMKYVRNLRNYFLEEIQEEIKQLKEDYVWGHAKFISPNKLNVNGKIIEAERIIIATGSRPHIPEEWKEFSQFFLTTDNFFELTDFPQSIAILGLGAVGLEIGLALSQLGVKVTGFCQHKFIGGLTDPEVNSIAKKIIEKNFPLLLEEKIKLSCEKNKLVITHTNKQYTFDKVLLATGRTPHLDHLDLQKLSLSLDKKGIPLFDPHTMKIEGVPIFLAGNITLDKAILPQAIDEGFIAGYNASHLKEQSFIKRTDLFIAFTDPTISIIGKNFASLEKENFIYGKAYFENQSCATLMARNQGIIKLYGEPGTGKIIGAEIMCQEGEHIAHLIALCIQHKLTVTDGIKLPFYHPVVEEGLLTAFKDMLSKISTSTPQSKENLDFIKNNITGEKKVHKNIHTPSFSDLTNILALGLPTPSLDLATADVRKDSLQNIMRVLAPQKFPANKNDLIGYAKERNGEKEVIELIKNLPEQHYTDLSAVVSAIQKMKLISNEFPKIRL